MLDRRQRGGISGRGKKERRGKVAGEGDDAV